MLYGAVRGVDQAHSISLRLKLSEIRLSPFFLLGRCPKLFFVALSAGTVDVGGDDTCEGVF